MLINPYRQHGVILYSFSECTDTKPILGWLVLWKNALSEQELNPIPLDPVLPLIIAKPPPLDRVEMYWL